MSRVVVITGCRLHFGLLAPRRERGRRFGGCGMMLEEPGCEVVVESSDADAVDAEPDLRGAIETARDQLRTRLRIEDQAAITVRRCIPRHAGLGSGTQLALAVASGIARIADRPADVSTLGHSAGRGRRSAVGVHGFELGGFLVDDGSLPGEPLGRLAARLAVPEDWRIVLVTPRPVSGHSGLQEFEAFEALPFTPEAEIAALRTLLDEAVVPAVRSADFTAFSAAIHEYGRLAGGLFAPVQGDAYSHPETARLVAELRTAGVRGVGQTSWGPTVFAFTRGEDEAGDLVASLRRSDVGRGAEIRVTRPRNRGATIERA